MWGQYCWQEAHLRSQHPAADPDNEDSGTDCEVCLDSLREKPCGAEGRENGDEDNPARMRQGHKDPEDKRINWATAHTHNVRSGNGLPMPRGRRMDSAQPKTGHQIEDALSHSLDFRDQGG